MVSNPRLLLRFVGVAGISLKERDMNGSCMSSSGLVALPPNDVGREVKLVLEEKDESERVEHDEDDRRLSQSTGSVSSCVSLV